MNKQEQLEKLKELYETTYLSAEVIGSELGLTGQQVRAWAKVMYSDEYRKERSGYCRRAANLGDKNPNFGKGVIKHGESKTRLHSCWKSMKYRARQRKDCNVFPEWEDYVPFATWARANGYTDELVLCRNGDVGNYEPSNVRWDTTANNLIEARARMYEFVYKGELITIYNLTEYCREHGLNYSGLSNVWSSASNQSQGYSLPEGFYYEA